MSDGVNEEDFSGPQQEGTGLRIQCVRCDEPITRPAALVFSPPDDTCRCIKTHLCDACYFDLTHWITKGLRP